MNKLNISDTYRFFNIIIAGVFLSILVYSGIFSSTDENYLFKCKYYELSGEKCPSCGLSRGLSESIRFHFKEANEFNTNATKLFIFFSLQSLIRILLLVFKIKSYHKKIIKLDIAIGITLFVICFYQFIFDWITFYINLFQ